MLKGVIICNLLTLYYKYEKKNRLIQYGVSTLYQIVGAKKIKLVRVPPINEMQGLKKSYEAG